MKDLGVLFDSQLTFKNHLIEITSRASRLYEASYRFVRDINHPFLMKKILNTYIVPVLEYASCVWFQDVASREREIEKIFLQMSRHV